MRTPLKKGGGVVNSGALEGCAVLAPAVNMHIFIVSFIFQSDCILFNQIQRCFSPQINRHAGEVIPHVKSYNQKQPLSIQRIVYTTHCL